jgi:hypothetical protein
MAASISPDGKMIAASENSVDNINNLVLLSSSDGNVMLSIPSPGNASLQRPQWTADGSRITVIYLTEAGEGIMSFTMADGSWKVLIEPARDDLQSAFLRNDSLFYISSVSGTDNIYLLSGNKISEVTRSRFGANDLSIKGSSIMFSDYTASGNDICIISASDIKNDPYMKIHPVSYLIDRFETEAGKGEENSDAVYTPEPYRKWQHLFGFHSWMPFYADIEAIQSDPFSLRPGVTLMSQNHLSTLISSFGYEYSADKMHKFHYRIAWKGWYPVVESRLDYMFQPWFENNKNASWIPSPASKGFTFRNSIYLPLTFSSGQFTQTFYPTISADYFNRYIFIEGRNSYDPGQLKVSGRLYFANFGRSAYRDIYPRWAQVIDLGYSYYPFDKTLFGPDLNLKTVLYLPGIIRNNGIKLRFETEKQNFGRFLTSNMIHYPRSYKNILSSELSFYSIDYAAPLFYPDFNISSILYLNRIRASLFYDFAAGTDNFHLTIPNGNIPYTEIKGTETFQSFGTEILADFYLLRIPFMITGGVQAAWKSFGETPSLELIFSIDIQGMTIGRSRM